MPANKYLQNPNTVSRIDSVKYVSLSPVAGASVGDRILVANPGTGASTGTATGAFVGHVGEIAINTGAGTWEFESSKYYPDEQVILIEDGMSLWAYSKKAVEKFKRTALTDPNSGGGAPLVQDLSNPKTFEALSTQGVQDAFDSYKVFGKFLGVANNFDELWAFHANAFPNSVAVGDIVFLTKTEKFNGNDINPEYPRGFYIYQGEIIPRWVRLFDPSFPHIEIRIPGHTNTKTFYPNTTNTFGFMNEGGSKVINIASIPAEQYILTAHSDTAKVSIIGRATILISEPLVASEPVVIVYLQLERGGFDRPLYHGFSGYFNSQDGGSGYSWTQDYLAGSAISLSTDKITFTLKKGFTYKVSYIPFRGSASIQSIDVAPVINGVSQPSFKPIGMNAASDASSINDPAPGSGYQTLLNVSKFAGPDATLSFKRTYARNGYGNTHSARIIIEAVAQDGGSSLPNLLVPREIKIYGAMGSLLAQGQSYDNNTVLISVPITGNGNAIKVANITSGSTAQVIYPGTGTRSNGVLAVTPSGSDVLVTIAETANTTAEYKSLSQVFKFIPPDYGYSGGGGNDTMYDIRYDINDCDWLYIDFDVSGNGLGFSNTSFGGWVDLRSGSDITYIGGSPTYGGKSIQVTVGDKTSGTITYSKPYNIQALRSITVFKNKSHLVVVPTATTVATERTITVSSPLGTLNGGITSIKVLEGIPTVVQVDLNVLKQISNTGVVNNTITGTNGARAVIADRYKGLLVVTAAAGDSQFTIAEANSVITGLAIAKSKLVLSGGMTGGFANWATFNNLSSFAKDIDENNGGFTIGNGNFITVNKPMQLTTTFIVEHLVATNTNLGCRIALKRAGVTNEYVLATDQHNNPSNGIGTWAVSATVGVFNAGDVLKYQTQFANYDNNNKDVKIFISEL